MLDGRASTVVARDGCARPGLGGADVTREARCLAAIIAGIEQSEAWTELFAELTGWTRSRAAGLFVVTRGTLCFDAHWGMSTEFLEGFRPRAAHDPRLAYAARFPRHQLVRDDAPELEPVLRASGIHQVKREFDLLYTGAAMLEIGSGYQAAFYLSRSRRQGPIDAQAAAKLELLAPHLARAWRVRRELAAVRSFLGEAPHPLTRRATPAPGRGSEEEAADTARQLPRQLARILLLLWHGASTREIAASLGLSLHTVRNHLRRLFELSGTHRRNALLAEARRRGWLVR
jgi:DNA-binding CsgD family transcriptional regulator